MTIAPSQFAPIDKTLVRVGSHRAREKLFGLLGGPTQGYFSWERSGSWYEVSADQYDAAQRIKGIGPAPRERADLRPFISWGANPFTHPESTS